MPRRRIWIAVLCAVALLGFIGGGLVGVFGGGDGGGTPAAAGPASTGSPGPTSRVAAEITTTPPTTPPPTSASPSASKSASPKPGLAAGRTYVLTLADGRAMDVMGESDRDGAAVIAYPMTAGKANQQWVVRDAGGGYVRLEAVHSHKCLEATDGRGARARQDDCGRGQNQLWKPQPSGAGVVLVSREGTALGLADQVKGQQSLALVPVGSGAVWKAGGA
ncbi:RICIN domain-containing protein [Embleya sp. NBC_00896]|uniref:RICIN domain-containing protein n=1 Tax=Embleya sp. NBC_00896 TaxID=2975961 RepID=UPI003865EF4A|nr:RICIN domain-containing protein [Embleya sp. NBC_00896]